MKTVPHARVHRPAPHLLGALAAIALFFGPIAAARAEDDSPTAPDGHRFYYYSPQDYGADAWHTPMNMIIEGGLGAVANKKLTNMRWGQGVEDLWYELTHPISSIREYGVGKFFYYEFTPHLGAGKNFIPNYMWHLIGGGFRTKMMEEYYTYHGYEHPTAMAWSTMYAMHLLNELVQVEHFNQYDNPTEMDHNNTVDALPDLFFFDWIGKVIFSFDVVNEFASDRLHLHEWSYQTQLNPMAMRLMNNGQLYWARYEIYKPISISYLTGEQVTSFGLTYELAGGRQISIGLGAKAKTFRKDENGNIDPEAISLNGGIYYSVRDNPLLVISYEEADPVKRDKYPDFANEYTDKLWINVYPGLVNIHGLKPGFSLSYQQDAVFAGISFGGWPIPVGIIGSSPLDQKYLDSM